MTRDVLRLLAGMALVVVVGTALSIAFPVAHRWSTGQLYQQSRIEALTQHLKAAEQQAARIRAELEIAQAQTDAQRTAYEQTHSRLQRAELVLGECLQTQAWPLRARTSYPW
jgi:hypothetical protein